MASFPYKENFTGTRTSTLYQDDLSISKIMLAMGEKPNPPPNHLKTTTYITSYPTCTMTSPVINTEEVNVKRSDQSIYR